MIRPKIDKLFASNALAGNIGDPDVFTPSSPAYPGRVEEQYKLGWFVEGAVVTKQPHQWINFYYNGIDLGIYSHASRFNFWSSKISYKNQAIVYFDSGLFKASVDNPSGTPSLINLDWAPCFSSLEEYMDLFNQTTSAHTTHINRRDNPHNLTPTQVDAYTIDEVDTSLAQCLAVVNDHKSSNNPHNVSFSQLGVLPTSGGVFTGPVVLHDMVLNHGAVRPVNSAIRLEAFGTRFGVRSDTGLNKDSLNVISFNNYEAIKIRNNPKFAKRTSDISLPLSGDLNFFSSNVVEEVEFKSNAYSFIDFTGKTVVLSANTAGFSLGLHVDRTKQQSLKLMGTISTGLSLSALVDGEAVFVFVSNGNNVNLIEVLNATSSIRDLNIWFGPVDDYFKSSII